MSAVKSRKRGESPAAGVTSPATQAARSQSRQDTLEKQVSAASPIGSDRNGGGAGAGRPPTGRRRRRAPTPPTIKEELPVDPYVSAVQQVLGADDGEFGAVMHVHHPSDDVWDTASVDDQNAGSGDALDGTFVKDTSMWNPHFTHAAVVILVSLFFIAVFSYYIPFLNGPVDNRKHYLSSVASKITNAVDILLAEYASAAELLVASQYGIVTGGVDTLGYLEQITASIALFQSATQRTDDSLSLVLQTHEAHLDDISALLGFVLDHALDLSALARVRDLAIKGGAAYRVFNGYDDVIHRLMMYQSKVYFALGFKDPNDRAALNSILSLRESDAMFLGALFTQAQNATASPTTAGRLLSMQSIDDFALAWRISAVISVNEDLRYGTTVESFQDASLSNTTAQLYRASLKGLGNIVVPYSFAMLSPSQSYSPIPSFWNVTFADVTLSSLQSSQRRAAALLEAQFAAHVDETFTPADVVRMPTIILLLVLSVVALVAHVANTVHYVQSKDQHDARNKEVRTMQKSLARMETFVAKASALDVAATSAILRRAQRARTAIPPEEMHLYSALSSLRDMEYFLPVTVTHPPPSLPKGALSKSDLFVNPALVHVKNAVAIHVSLSVFHSQFANAGTKQKAVQHQMTRALGALQEIADEHLPQSGGGALLSVHGDHAMLWVNVVSRPTYPSMRAFSIAIAMREECERQGIRAPRLCIACGDALVGHVSSRSPSAPPHAPYSSAFTGFGTVARDMIILDNLSAIHEFPITANNAAVMAYFEEHIEYDSDIFNNPSGRVGLHENDESVNLRVVAATSSGGDNAAEATGGLLGGSKNRSRNTASATATTAVAPRQKFSVDERFSQLHCFFRPVEMVNAATSRASEDTFAMLERQMTTTKERASALRERRGEGGVIANAQADDTVTLSDGSWFKDYSRDVVDGSVVFPCFTVIPFSSSKEDDEQAMRAWSAAFETYVRCCETCTADTCSVSMQALSDFTNRFPHFGGTVVDRLKKSLLAARNTGTIGVSAASLKRSRLVDTLCV